MNRRDFLTLSGKAFAGLLVAPYLRLGYTPKRVFSFYDDEKYSIFELFGAYSTRVGSNITDYLALDPGGADERKRNNYRMSDDGYTHALGDAYQTQVDRQPTVDHYMRLHEDFFNGCAVFYPDYAYGMRKPLLESAGIAGLAVATADYANRTKATVAAIRDVFFPIGYLKNAQEENNLFTEGREVVIFKTAVGTVVVTDPGTPLKRGEIGLNIVAKTSDGTTLYNETHPFVIHRY